MDDIEAQASRMKLWLNAFKGAYIAGMPYTLIGTGVLVLIVFLFWLFHQSVSPNEQKAIDAREQVTISNVNTAVEAKRTDEAVKTVKDAEKRSQTASKRATEARQHATKGVNVSEAQKNCEDAYPGECGN